ncbi:MAG: chalcone isomerase family protein [Sulfuritalea sp.]|nr:chalcone isomerase family protein [Sulfuritalea sp.]
MNKLLAILLLALSLPAFAALEVGDVKFDDKAKVGAGDTVINGAGMRKVLFIKGYAMALYLPQKAAATTEVLAMKGAKRIRMVLLRDASGETFAGALASGIQKNHSEQEIVPLNARIEAFKATMIAAGAVTKGTAVHLDWLPDVGGGVTRLTIGGEKKGEDVAGEDFYRALLKIWLGDQPIQDDLKQNLLGKTAS